MKRVWKNFLDFESKHPEISFLVIFVLTIAIVRILTFIQDPNIIIQGFELHHFFYGLILLIIINLDMIFGNKHPRTYITLSAIGIGLVADEFFFILGRMSNEQYLSSWPSALIFTILVIVLAVGIEYFQKKK